MRVELIVRVTYDITDTAIATDLRPAVAVDDRSRIDELLCGMEPTSDHVLEIREIPTDRGDQ